MSQKTPIYQPPSMIESILQLNKERLEEVAAQLKNFEKGKDIPHIFDDALIQRSTRVYQEQKEFLAVPRNQCVLWKEKETLSEDQVQKIENLEETLQSLENMMGQILFLLDEFKDQTIINTPMHCIVLSNLAICYGNINRELVGCGQSPTFDDE